jgi:hypothetical protein
VPAYFVLNWGLGQMPASKPKVCLKLGGEFIIGTAVYFSLQGEEGGGG